MARKKKSGNAAMQMQMPSSSSESMSTDIATAENGFIVNVSGNKGGKDPSYFSKRFIAHSRPQALRIANQAHAAGAVRGKSGRKGGRKRAAKSL
jgi:hypothetical protein